MKNILIIMIIFILLSVAGFIWCLPYSSHPYVLIRLFNKIIKSLVFVYSIYLIYWILDKLGLFEKGLKKTLGLIKYIPYLVTFESMMLFLMAVVVVFGDKDYDAIYMFLLLPASLHVNKLVNDLAKRYNK